MALKFMSCINLRKVTVSSPFHNACFISVMIHLPSLFPLHFVAFVFIDLPQPSVKTLFQYFDPFCDIIIIIIIIIY